MTEKSANNHELAIDAIDVEFYRVCSNCGRYCDDDGACPSDACRELTAAGFKLDEELHNILNLDGFSDEAIKLMNRNVKQAIAAGIIKNDYPITEKNQAIPQGCGTNPNPSSRVDLCGVTNLATLGKRR